MADAPDLNQGPREGDAEDSAQETWDYHVPQVFKGDKTVNRASLYFFIFLVLFVGAAGPARSGWISGPTLHGVLETLSTLLAFVVGSLALVRFYSKKQGTFLFIGTGFLGTGVLDTVHSLVSSGVMPGLPPDELESLSTWSYTGAGVFLSMFLALSWAPWWWERRSGRRTVVRELTVYLSALLLGVVIFALFDLMPASQAQEVGGSVRHPAEFLPAVFFLVALLGYLAKGLWRHDVFEHWLVVALLIAVMGHGAYMPFSMTFYDADFDAAHLLKVLSYAGVLVGLMASVYVTFRREEESAEATREANAALAREIDFRRHAERIIQESEERLQDFLDNAHDLIQSVGPEGKFLYVNRAWKEVLGYSDRDLEKLTLYDVLDPGCRERSAREFAAVLDGHTLPRIEVDFLAADGRVVRCAGSANARFQDGRPVATRSIFRDITAQVEARRELEAFQANLQALVENTGDAIWSVDRRKRLITFNTAFSMAMEVRTGREPAEGDNPRECFPVADAPWYEERYDRSLHGEAFSELRDEEVGGQIRSFELFFNPIREASGISGVAVFGKDVTARRRTQMALRIAKEEAERANQAKSQFLANMSHELRTPLNSVIGFTNILLKNRGGSFSQQEIGFLDRIAANGKHLLELINEVLDLAKIEAGRMELELAPVELKALVRETLAQMEGQVKGRSIVLRGEVPDGLESFQTDQGKLKQVIINLVGNALKFTEDGEVVVRVVPASDGRAPAAISVQDTGIGIPPERLQAIFEAFQQADGTTGRKYGGTGLGLTISRSLCQLMGLDLQVESEEGVGSTFSILLTDIPAPARRAEEELMEEALRPMESSRPGSPSLADQIEGRAKEPPIPRVLVIDDDQQSRTLISHQLETLGYSVVAVSSADQGLEAARQEKPDLITLDLLMPEVTGWDALKTFKADPDLQDIPVVIISVVSGSDDRGKLLGAVDHLTKPVDRSDLMKVVRRNLGEDRGRTVLVVEDDPDTQLRLREYLEEVGLRVIVAGNGEEAEAALEDHSPSVVLLDLVMPVMDGTAFLHRLRKDPRGVEIPVVVCTERELDRSERGRLLAQATEIVRKGEGLEESLTSVLSSFFSLDRPGTGLARRPARPS